MHIINNINKIDALFRNLKGSDDAWFPTFSPTMLGTTNDAINRIPDYADAVMDIRFPQPYTTKEIIGKIKDVTDDRFEITVLIGAEPTELKPDPHFFKITEEITGEKVSSVRDHGGSDARFFSQKGIPVIISRPLVGKLHSEEEWIDINSMLTFYRIYERYISERCLK